MGGQVALKQGSSAGEGNQWGGGSRLDRGERSSKNLDDVLQTLDLSGLRASYSRLNVVPDPVCVRVCAEDSVSWFSVAERVTANCSTTKWKPV